VFARSRAARTANFRDGSRTLPARDDSSPEPAIGTRPARWPFASRMTIQWTLVEVIRPRSAVVVPSLRIDAAWMGMDNCSKQDQREVPHWGVSAARIAGAGHCAIA